LRPEDVAPFYTPFDACEPVQPNKLFEHKKTDLHKEYTFFGSSAISSG
jgi:hypothetical protein